MVTDTATVINKKGLTSIHTYIKELLHEIISFFRPEKNMLTIFIIITDFKKDYVSGMRDTL